MTMRIVLGLAVLLVCTGPLLAEGEIAARFEKGEEMLRTKRYEEAVDVFKGIIHKWPEDKAEDEGLTVWSLAAHDSQWFSPSTSSFMINYRVDDLDELLEQLRAGGVEVVSGPESHENGKFAWIMDPEGNKVELWEPMIWDDKNKG